jgi:gas vesicle protein
MFKTGLVVGFAAGYVFGTKAGRERYEQIAESVRSFSKNPGVQRLTDEVNRTVNVGKERASTVATQAVEQASSTLADTASKAREKVTSKTTKADSSSSTADSAAPAS